MYKLLRRVFNKAIRFIDQKEQAKAVSEYIDIKESSTLVKSVSIDLRIGGENRKYVTIGEKCILHAHFIFESKSGGVFIGNNVQMGGVTFLCKTRIEIEDDVTMAWGITVYDHNSNSIYWEERQNDNSNSYTDYIMHNGNRLISKDWSNVVTKPVIIKSKVWIGFNVIILKGVIIGEGAVVGANSVVTKDIEPWTVVGGNPAVFIRKIK
jgi:acetyltransferase-like isoleucine patch superfamily enzyme